MVMVVLLWKVIDAWFQCSSSYYKGFVFLMLVDMSLGVNLYACIHLYSFAHSQTVVSCFCII